MERSSSSLHQRFEDEAVPFARALYASALRKSRNASDAEDLVQETLLRAYRAFDRFEPETNVRAWLHTILGRAWTDTIRRRARRPLESELLEDDGPQAAVPAPQEQLADGRERVQRALEQVPETFRTALVLRDVEGHTYDEIAAIVGVPAGTVMSRIHRGRTALRALLTAEGQKI